MTKDKTVYILGAGASKAVKLPLQTELLPEIFSLKSIKSDMELDKDFMELDVDKNTEDIQGFYLEFDRCRRVLAEFIIANFASIQKESQYRVIVKMALDIPEFDSEREQQFLRAYKIAQEVNVTLEDLFTIFDKVSTGHEHFRVYTPEKLKNVHDALCKCIIFILVYDMNGEKDNIKTYRLFAQKIIEKRMNASPKDDILSIITTNWDTVFERELYQQCVNLNHTLKRTKLYPDLCFYDYCYSKDNERIVSTHVKARGNRNIKFLKMHGSLNWLACPRCGRVYVDYNEDIAIRVLTSENYCPYCYNQLLSDESGNPELRSILITPTFLKEFGDIHLKNIWHNAFIELSEAKKVVFIGYSFPDADFEMRCLLKKAVPSDAEIDVVLHSSDNPEIYIKDLKEHGFSGVDVNRYLQKINLPENRYRCFFGSDNINFSYLGIEAYLNTM